MSSEHLLAEGPRQVEMMPTYAHYGQCGSMRLPMIVIRLFLGSWPVVLQPHYAVREARTQSTHPGANAWCSRLTKMPLRLPSLSLEQCINETNPALLEQAEYLSRGDTYIYIL